MTLIELMVGVFIALFLTAAAVAFASHETRLLGYSNEKLDMEQSSRAAIDLLVSDLKMAGAGVGYCSTVIGPCLQTGQFLGVLQGNFAVPGGLQFNTSGGGHTDLRLAGADQGTGAPIGNSYTLPTEDLLVMMADGTYATVYTWNGLGGDYCDGARVNFRDDEQVLIRSEDTLLAMSGMIRQGAARPCADAPTSGCVGGCRAFTWTPATSNPNSVRFTSELLPPNANFTGGEVMGGFRAIAWFVENDPSNANVAQLRRVVFDGAPGPQGACTDRATCGVANAVAENVETLQYQVWEFQPGRPPGTEWRAYDAGLPIVTSNRLRIDVEIVMRARVGDERLHQPVALRLRPDTCVPGGAGGGADCGGVAPFQDYVERKAHRVSVEIKNSGRMMMN